MNQLTFSEQLEKHGNEADVRDRMARGLYHGQHLDVAQEWLRRIDEARVMASSAARDAREEAMLSSTIEANRLASEANSIARSQTAAAWRAARYAMYAAAIAAVAAIAGSKDQLIALIFGGS